jgi:GTP-sensing pleiotropic transcriptional regulator CodY
MDQVRIINDKDYVDQLNNGLLKINFNNEPMYRVMFDTYKKLPDEYREKAFKLYEYKVVVIASNLTVLYHQARVTELTDNSIEIR